MSEIDFQKFQEVVLDGPDNSWHQVGQNIYLRRYGSTLHVQLRSDYPEQEGELVIRSEDVFKLIEALFVLYRGIEKDVDKWHLEVEKERKKREEKEKKRLQAQASPDPAPASRS